MLHLHSISLPCSFACFCIYFSWKYTHNVLSLSLSSSLLCHLEPTTVFVIYLLVCVIVLVPDYRCLLQFQLSHPISVLLVLNEQSWCIFHQFRHTKMLKNPPLRLKMVQITVGHRVKTAPEFCFTGSLPFLFLSHSSLTHFNLWISPHVTFPSLFLLISISFLSLPRSFSSTPQYKLWWSIYQKNGSQSLIIMPTLHKATLCAKCKMKRCKCTNMKRKSLHILFCLQAVPPFLLFSAKT